MPTGVLRDVPQMFGPRELFQHAYGSYDVMVENVALLSGWRAGANGR